MKQQVARLSPHQNGKVFGVLMAIGSFILVLPFFALFAATVPAGAGGTPSIYVFLIAPLIYLIFGYLSVAIGCLLYNFMFKYLGGIEYEATPNAAA